MNSWGLGKEPTSRVPTFDQTAIPPVTNNGKASNCGPSDNRKSKLRETVDSSCDPIIKSHVVDTYVNYLHPLVSYSSFFPQEPYVMLVVTINPRNAFSIMSKLFLFLVSLIILIQWFRLSIINPDHKRNQGKQ